jgi:hypothetical protein
MGYTPRGHIFKATPYDAKPYDAIPFMRYPSGNTLQALPFGLYLLSSTLWAICFGLLLSGYPHQTIHLQKRLSYATVDSTKPGALVKLFTSLRIKLSKFFSSLELLK